MVQRLALVAVALVALAVPANARAALVFVFDQPSASPNDRVTLRTGGTPKAFTLRQQMKPLQRPVRVYLVRADLATEIRSRLDPRLQFLASIALDQRGRALVTLSVPPLDSGTYTLAYWCPGCTTANSSRTFFVQRSGLRINATPSCPVTLPNASRPPDQPRSSWYGNGLLWAGVGADGIYAVDQDDVGADGSIGNKLLWVTTPRWSRPTISGERLDADAPPLRVLRVNQGSFAGAPPSYMSPVSFPTAGCWRLTARVDDVSLSYVVEVVVRTP